VEEVKARIYSGTLFGFFQTLMMAFAMLIPTFYFKSLGLSLAAYATLLAIGDVVSFLMKPTLGWLTDRHGERKFMMLGGILFVVSLFLIGQTTDLFIIAILKIISGVASALVFILILIYSLRLVKEKPERKIGAFGSVYNLGWVVGLSILFIIGLLYTTYPVKEAFYLILIVGVVWVLLMVRFAKHYESTVSVKLSFSHFKKIPALIVFKSMDLAMFSAFLFYLIYNASNTTVSLPRTTLLVIVETLLFAVSIFIVGRLSTPILRRYWVPLCITFHLLAAVTMLFAVQLNNYVLYFLVAIFIGVAGGFIDIWIYTRISEHYEPKEKGIIVGTLGWSYDLATILGANVPVLMAYLGYNVFTALFIFPIAMLITYIIFLSTTRKIRITD
jgi:MFS family permease